jgi:hypothetical protein
MNENVISSNLTKAIHFIWRKKRHLIKSNKRVILSNFWKDKRSFYFFDKQFLAATFDVKNLALQRVIFIKDIDDKTHNNIA